jgi:hypothetical protein
MVSFHLYEVPRISTFPETESRIEVTSTWGQEVRVVDYLV